MNFIADRPPIRVGHGDPGRREPVDAVRAATDAEDHTKGAGRQSAAVIERVNDHRAGETKELARQLGVQAREWRGLESQYIEGVIDGLHFRWHQFRLSKGWRWQLTVREADLVIASGLSTPTTRSSSLLHAIREVRVWAAALECPLDHAAQSTEGARYCSRCGALTSDPLSWKVSAGTGIGELA